MHFLRNLLIVLSLFAGIVNAKDINKSFKANVELSPAGSFVIKSNKIKGKLYKKGNSFIAKEMKIAVKSLKTGIDLRDEHLHKKLGGANAFLTLIALKGSDGKGSALFEVAGKKQKTEVSYTELSDKWVEFKLKLSNKKFGLTGIRYMGVGVEDEVNVSVVLPFSKK